MNEGDGSMLFRESETIELKEVVVDEIKKEIIAFANCDGGKLYIGVQDDGTVVGVDDPDGVSLQISNMVRDAIKPDVTMFVHYKTIEENGKDIVAVDIQRGTDRLGAFKSAAALQHTTPQRALAGMMAKHIISIYDMCFTDRKTFELAVWEEKITDSLNYLFLLKAVIKEELEYQSD